MRTGSRKRGRSQSVLAPRVVTPRTTGLLAGTSLVQYNHGVTVSERELEATSNTWHGGGTKPTLVFQPAVQRMGFTVRKKQAELRIGAVQWDGYAEVMEQTTTAGQSWYRDECPAIFLCCYGQQAKLYHGNQRLGLFDISVAEGDVLAVSLSPDGVRFELNNEELVCHELDGEERCLGVQFHATGDIVELDRTCYNHGVKVEGRTLTAVCDTQHGQPEKPTVLVNGPLAFRILKKQAEMRIGLVDPALYMDAVSGGAAGQSWYSDSARNVALFLCFYNHSSLLFNGKEKLARLESSAAEGDVVSVRRDGDKICFDVNGTEVAATSQRTSGLFGIQFHTTGDAVELVSATSYNHGVKVEGRTLTAVCETQHGHPEKPTMLFTKPLAVRILKKQAEMRIGLVDPALYMAAVAAGAAGQSWYSDSVQGAALFLCFYRSGSILFDGNQQLERLDSSATEGDVVAVRRDGDKLSFGVNGAEVAASSVRTRGLFGIQFHTTGDAVELLSEASSAVDKGGVSVSLDLPPLRTVKLPPSVQERVPPDGFLLRPLAADEAMFAMIRGLFTVTSPDDLHKGRDVSGSFPDYDDIRPVAAWQIMGWRNLTYESACQLLARKIKSRPDLVVRPVPTKLEPHCDGSLTLDDSIAEKLLLHGTAPDKVVPILANGLNERFSGGLFGNGTYLAEQPEKIDQYVYMDEEFDASGELADLHARLYSSEKEHPGKCFYAFVCRAALGCSISTQDGETALEDGVGSVWAVRPRELARVPGASPPEHFHAMVAELGGKINRHREFLVFHSDRILPEFLVAYHRTCAGEVVP